MLKLYIDMTYLIISIVLFYLFYNTVLKRIFISNKQENSIKRNLADNSLTSFNKTVEIGTTKNFQDSEHPLKQEFYRKSKELGLSDEQTESAWIDYKKNKLDNRFLKNVASIRAKHVH